MKRHRTYPMPRAPASGTSKRASKAKQVQVVAVVGSNGEIQGSFTPEPKRPLVAHLPFRSSDIQFQDGPLVYDPRPPGVPEPYDASADDMFHSGAELIDQTQKEEDSFHTLPPAISESAVEANTSGPITQGNAHIVEEKEVKAFQTIDVMIEYKHCNETRTLPESVSAACFWCAGGFEGRPVVLPVKEEQGVYHVYGNFCTLSCGLSYLLTEAIDPQVRWERQALFHRMYKQLTPIQPAPPRESLRFFGGSLTHDQYRGVIGKRAVRVDAHLPPVISILSTLDTKPIDFYETSFRNTTVSLESMKAPETGLRLKRSKPLKDRESTLDAVMNLQVKARA
jgi:hypothetical protein